MSTLMHFVFGLLPAKVRHLSVDACVCITGKVSFALEPGEERLA